MDRLKICNLSILLFRDDAIKVLLQCQNLPMSIVIIGVGDENFKYMK